MNAPLARRALATWIGLALISGLLALAAAPTGAASPEATVPSDARIAARHDLAPVVVLLTVAHGDLAIVVAYHRPKGWFAATAESLPRSVETSWTATDGAGPVPPLAVAYGHASAGTVRVAWDDGSSDVVPVASDGLWLAARRGRLHLSRVTRAARDGSITSEETAP